MRGPSQFVRPGSCAIPHDGWSAKAVKPKLLEALRPGGRRSRDLVLSELSLWILAWLQMRSCNADRHSIPRHEPGRDRLRRNGPNARSEEAFGRDLAGVDVNLQQPHGPFRSSKPEAIPQTLLATRHQPRKSTD